MKNKTVKIAAALLAACITVTPTVTSFATLSTNAAFIETTNDKITIDETILHVSDAQIDNLREKSTLNISATGEQGSEKITDEKGNKRTATGYRIKCSATDIPILSDMTINFTVTGPQSQKSKIKNELENSIIYTKKAQNDTEYTTPSRQPFAIKKPVVTPVKEDNNSVTFKVAFYATAFATALDFETSVMESLNKNDISCKEGYIEFNNSKYSIITVKPSLNNTEGLKIRVSKMSNNLKPKYKKWAHRLCMYANSLSNMTGVSNGTLYLIFDEDYFSKTSVSVDSMSTFDSGRSKAVYDYIESGKDMISWVELHEIAHDYCYDAYHQPFFDNFHYGSDDLYTNIRGLAAIQNCTNLENIDINYDNLCVGKYGDILDKIIGHPSIEDKKKGIFIIEKDFLNVANDKNWNALESFFNSNKVYTSATTKAVFSEFKNFYKNIAFNNGTNPPKLAIALYSLYENAALNGYGGTYNTFLRKYFKEGDMKEFINSDHGSNFR